MDHPIVVVVPHTASCSRGWFRPLDIEIVVSLEQQASKNETKKDLRDAGTAFGSFSYVTRYYSLTVNNGTGTGTGAVVLWTHHRSL